MKMLFEVMRNEKRLHHLLNSRKDANVIHLCCFESTDEKEIFVSFSFPTSSIKKKWAFVITSDVHRFFRIILDHCSKCRVTMNFLDFLVHSEFVSMCQKSSSKDLSELKVIITIATPDTQNELKSLIADKDSTTMVMKKLLSSKFSTQRCNFNIRCDWENYVHKMKQKKKEQVGRGRFDGIWTRSLDDMKMRRMSIANIAHLSREVFEIAKTAKKDHMKSLML